MMSKVAAWIVKDSSVPKEEAVPSKTAETPTRGTVKAVEPSKIEVDWPESVPRTTASPDEIV